MRTVEKQEELYTTPVQLFARAMEREMVASHALKGHGLPKLDRAKLRHELDHHVAKLYTCVDTFLGDLGKNQTPSPWLHNRVLEFAADVGNCAMFFADSLGVLSLERIEAREEEADFVETSYKDAD